MIHDLLLWITVAGALITGFAAIGTRVLYEFSRRELELYCRRRNRRSLFHDILDRHEDLAAAAESLRVVGTVLFILAAGLWFFPAGTTPADLPRLAILALTVTLVLLALTSWLPSAVVRVWSAPFLFHTWPLWKGIAKTLWPFTLGVRLVDVVIHRLAGQEETEEDEEEAFEDEIRTIVSAGLRDGLLEADAREMIEGVIELGDVDVAEIMTPRSDIDALAVETPWPESLRFIVKVARTRIPVYEENLDNIVGILYVKDLLAEFSEDGGTLRRPLRELLRTPWFVPKSKAVDDLLQEFRRTRSHMAIVVDEYRATAGVVTIEDALEEIVGEIADEMDTEEEVDLVRIDESVLEADGRVHIDELNEQFGLGLPESDEYDTIAGFAMHLSGRLPTKGDVFYWRRIRLTILKASPRRVERVRLELLEEPQPGSA